MQAIIQVTSVCACLLKTLKKVKNNRLKWVEEIESGGEDDMCYTPRTGL